MRFYCFMSTITHCIYFTLITIHDYSTHFYGLKSIKICYLICSQNHENMHEKNNFSWVIRLKKMHNFYLFFIIISLYL